MRTLRGWRARPRRRRAARAAERGGARWRRGRTQPADADADGPPRTPAQPEPSCSCIDSAGTWSKIAFDRASEIAPDRLIQPELDRPQIEVGDRIGEMQRSGAWRVNGVLVAVGRRRRRSSPRVEHQTLAVEELLGAVETRVDDDQLVVAIRVRAWVTHAAWHRPPGRRRPAAGPSGWAARSAAPSAPGQNQHQPTARDREIRAHEPRVQRRGGYVRTASADVRHRRPR